MRLWRDNLLGHLNLWFRSITMHSAAAHSTPSLAARMRSTDGAYREAITNLALELVNSEPVHPRPTGLISLWRAVSGRKPL